MTLPDIIAIAAIVLIIGGAVFYIIRAKKKGKKCIGCPYSESCGAKSKDGCAGCGGCSHGGQENSNET